MGVQKIKELPILFVLIGISLVITIANPSFATLENVLDLLKGNLTLAIMALGMLVVILTGGIDVSAASIITAVTVTTGYFLIHISSNLAAALLVAVLTGTVMGLVNGLLVARLKIPPIVTTLGTMSIILGIVLYLTNGNWMTGIPENFIRFGRLTILRIPLKSGRVIGFPVQSLFLIVSAALTWFLLKRTVTGRGVYAIGGNLESAERMGFKSNRILVFVYAYEGFLIGLAAVSHTSIMRQVDPNAFLGFEMQVIAAVVLGGASTLGGTGSVSGTLLGVAIFCVINNGLILMKIPTFWQKIVVGIIITGSIAIDMAQKKRLERKQIRVDVE
ncbi:MAG: ABC transporter permease [Spirochaetaceae bacterium]|jgi:ribose/xylose/arabinose/galactoside ABC-type transport system permease subunit|nr:ABC transporter permease [Spirochaetaceae bacterium]